MADGSVKEKLSDDLATHERNISPTDGATFDDSHGNIVTLPLNAVIKGWTEGMQLMRPGDVWMLYVPPELGYGAKGAGPIPPNAALVFRIELVAVAGHG